MHESTHLPEARDDAAAPSRLFAAAYDDLKRLARRRLREGGRSTCIDTTALVHESYLRLLGSELRKPGDRGAFLSYAARVMRSVVIDALRERSAERRGGAAQRVQLDTTLSDRLGSGEAEVLAVHEALLDLERAEPRLARVVEMRYFGGYGEVEIAEALGVTERTVRRDWDKARLLLLAALRF
jgi:RNA polymerase sigma factor (TIGR02999 family)